MQGSAVFLRAANVGGHQRFRPKDLVRELAPLDVRNLGAAGTFAVRERVNQRELQQLFARHLPFETDIIIRPARDIARILEDHPYPDLAWDRDQKRFLTVLAGKSRLALPAGLRLPEGREWQIEILEERGRFVFTHWRRKGKQPLDLNQAIEKRCGVACTTRGWETIERLRKLFD